MKFGSYWERRDFLRWTAYGLCGLTGCRPAAETDEGGEMRTAAPRPITLKVIVVDDPALAEAAEQQWQLRGEGALEVEAWTSEQLDQAERAPQADAIIYASGQLGMLVERGWLLPFTDELLRDPNLAWRDVFASVRLREVLWDRATYALPFGSPTLLLLYRGDLWDQHGLAPPQTWSDYQQALETLRAAAPDGPQNSAEPLGPGWAGQVLLARAAAYALHRGYLALWFDLETMVPQIASPPFERALRELASACPNPDALQWNPTDALERLVRGEALGAVTWPTRHTSLGAAAQELGRTLRVSELPGSAESYHRERQEWSARDAAVEGLHVTLLGVAGRVGSVLKRSTHRSAAANLLVWLTGPEWGSVVGAASSATTLCRQTQLEDLEPWLPAGFPEQPRSDFAVAIQSTLERPGAVTAPRIPGRGEYLAALDEAVAAVLRQEQSPADALQTAAATWQEITNRRGRSQQQVAYRRSLGL